MSQLTVYLVTGASRGIGLHLASMLSSRPETIVLAGVRSIPLPPDSDLARIVERCPQNVLPLKLTSADAADNQEAAQYIQERWGKVDVIIANAGASTGITPIGTVALSDILSDFHVNTLGPLILYQTFASLLSSSTHPEGAKFVVISSILGQITESLAYTYNAYGISKAAVNFVTKKIDQEDARVTAFPIHPGVVDTDMGRSGAASVGMTTEQLGAITPDESARGILNVIHGSTKKKHGGRFWDYTGTELTY